MKVIDKNHIKKECLMKEYIIALQQHKKYIFIGILALLPFFYIISLMTNSSMKYPEDKMYFCTAADSRFYEHVQNLIGSIHRIHFHETQEIACLSIKSNFVYAFTFPINSNANRFESYFNKFAN